MDSIVVQESCSLLLVGGRSDKEVVPVDRDLGLDLADRPPSSHLFCRLPHPDPVGGGGQRVGPDLLSLVVRPNSQEDGRSLWW